MTEERTPNSETLASLHDSDLIAIEMDRAARRLILVFQNPLGAAVELVSDGVVGYRIDNVQPLNIASRVRSSSLTAIAAGELLQISRWRCSDSTGLSCSIMTRLQRPF